MTISSRQSPPSLDFPPLTETPLSYQKPPLFKDPLDAAEFAALETEILQGIEKEAPAGSTSSQYRVPSIYEHELWIAGLELGALDSISQLFLEENMTRDAGGLPNLGNTCWFNSLTNLFYPGSSYLQSLDEPATDPAIKARRSSFKELLDLKDDLKTDTVTLKTKLESFLKDFTKGYDDFNLKEQQDIKERLDNLIDYLDLHTTAANKPLVSATHFQAYNSKTMRLDRESKIKQDALALCLPANCQSIQQGIEQFGHPQILDEAMDFEGLKKPTLQTIFYELKKTEDVPTTLTVQISRFNSSQMKDHTRVVLNPTIQFPFCDESGTSNRIAEYSLRFIACHHGETIFKGHYSALRPDSTKAGNFNLYDDDKPIASMSLDAAETTAYLLGYQFTRIDSNSTPLTIDDRLSNFLRHHPQTDFLKKTQCQKLTYYAGSIILAATSILYALKRASNENES